MPQGMQLGMRSDANTVADSNSGPHRKANGFMEKQMKANEKDLADLQSMAIRRYRRALRRAGISEDLPPTPKANEIAKEIRQWLLRETARRISG